MADVSVERWGIRFASPVVLASGPAGFGLELAEGIDLSRVGALTLKTVTPAPRSGNPQPRLVDCPAGALNSIGLDNPGIDGFRRRILPKLEGLPTNVIGSATGPSPEEAARVVASLSEASSIRMIELNLSCPNVAEDVVGGDPRAVSSYVRASREVHEGILLVKFPGDSGDLLEATGAALEAGADGVTLINSLRGMRVDWRAGRPFLKSVFGGLSGPAILPIALARVYDVRRAFPEAVIVGTGGVVELGSLVEMLMAGADLVGIGFGLMADPQIGCRLTTELGRWLDERGMPSVSEIQGMAQVGGDDVR
jgi:dihydroorotate dehydrogenase (NAD+) catalytic subunit